MEFSSLHQDAKIENSTDDAKIVIMNVNVNHEGLYRCIAENVIGRDVFDYTLIVQCKYDNQLPRHYATWYAL